jgi:RNA polymerase sigma factor (sigma-70 family)
MEFLSKVAEHHNEWLKVTRAWNTGDLAEDIVQDMYLRLHKYSSGDKVLDEDGKVNKFYVYCTLRNIFHDYNNEKTKRGQTRIGEGFDLPHEDTDYSEADAYNRLIDTMNESLTDLYWFDKDLLMLYVESGLSMRQLSEKTNISFKCIFNTLKVGRQQVREQIGEDYEDFRNGDFERV